MDRPTTTKRAESIGPIASNSLYVFYRGKVINRAVAAGCPGSKTTRASSPAEQAPRGAYLGSVHRSSCLRGLVEGSNGRPGTLRPARTMRDAGGQRRASGPPGQGRELGRPGWATRPPGRAGRAGGPTSQTTGSRKAGGVEKSCHSQTKYTVATPAGIRNPTASGRGRACHPYRSMDGAPSVVARRNRAKRTAPAGASKCHWPGPWASAAAAFKGGQPLAWLDMAGGQRGIIGMLARRGQLCLG
jgi:hypothetical protein